MLEMLRNPPPCFRQVSSPECLLLTLLSTTHCIRYSQMLRSCALNVIISELYVLDLVLFS